VCDDFRLLEEEKDGVKFQRLVSEICPLVGLGKNC
jgi:hypothetical protein